MLTNVKKGLIIFSTKRRISKCKKKNDEKEIIFFCGQPFQRLPNSRTNVDIRGNFKAVRNEYIAKFTSDIG